MENRFKVFYYDEPRSAFHSSYVEVSVVFKQSEFWRLALDLRDWKRFVQVVDEELVRKTRCGVDEGQEVLRQEEASSFIGKNMLVQEESRVLRHAHYDLFA